MLVPVSNLQITELNPYRTLRRPVEHWQQGIFVAEGHQVVIRLLNSNLSIISFLMTYDWQQKIFPDPDQITAPIYVAEKKLLEAIVGFRLHQGIMAVARVPDHGRIHDFLSGREKCLLVALDGISTAENVGAIVRNCAAFGADAILSGSTSASPYLRRAVRNSMGTVFKMPVYHLDPLLETLVKLRNEFGIKIFAAHPAGKVALSDVRFSEKALLVFGSEGKGVSEELLNIADEQICIPMHNETDSLNVASASAVFLYEASKGK